MVLAWIILFLGTWTASSWALVFTNSFDGWIGNSTYVLTWDSSASDPKLYDLTIARPSRVPTIGQQVDSNTPLDYFYTFAWQIPSNGDHHLRIDLPQSLYPGIYVILMTGTSNTALTPAFPIGANYVSPGTTITIIGSYVQVTATATGVVTQSGHTITVKPSDVFSSAVVYTTVIVMAQPGKGTPVKVPLIVGLVFGVGFLVTLPIIVWLILRYRRRPKGPDNEDNWDASTPYKIENTRSSAINLLEQNEATKPTNGTHKVWAIVNGEKRLIAVPQDPRQPASDDPFADSVPPSPSHPQSLPRLSIPRLAPHITNSSLTPSEAPANALAESTANSSPSGRSQVGEKASQVGSQQASPTTPRTLTREEVSSRIFVPGRALDMGPLARTQVGDVDENGLLPPNYFQATQPLPSTGQGEPSPNV